MERLEAFQNFAKKARSGSTAMEFILGILMITALVFAYTKSSLLLLIIAILLWIVNLLIKIAIGIQLNLAAQLIALDRADKDQK